MMRIDASKPLLEQLSVAWGDVVDSELGSGYRGYFLRKAGLYRHGTHGLLHGCVHMLMPNSPLHPNDAMYVDSEITEPLNLATLETYAMNAVYSIRRLIDDAYDKPEDVSIMRFDIDAAAASEERE